MSYHYTREAGLEGNILTLEGEAEGIDLATLLDRERPPIKVALEIGSALADILTISEEDGAVHGDIKPGIVKVDGSGAVSIEGFGVPRRTSRAPEGRPIGLKTDMFGLGVVLHSLMSPEPLGRLPKDPDAHDNAVIDRVLAMDFSEVEGRRWLEEVRRFLCQIMAYYPEDRPEALDAANVLAEVGSKCPGRGLVQWAPRSIGTGGGQAAPRRRAPGPITEDLGGPEAISGPLPADFSGGFKNQRTAPSAKGESTAFWSREKIAALLAEEEDDDSEELPPAQNFREPRQIDAPQPSGRRRPAAPPEEDLGGPVAAQWSSPASTPEPPRLPQAPSPPAWEPPPPPPPEPIQREPVRTPPPYPPPRQEPPQRSASDDFFGDEGFDGHDEPTQPRDDVPPPPDPRPQHFNIQGPTAASYDDPDAAQPDPDEKPSSSPLKWVAIGVAVMVFGCLGLGGIGGAAYWFFSNQGTGDVVEPDPSDVVQPEDPTDQPKEKVDTGTIPEAPPDAPPPEPDPPKPPPKTTSSSGSSGSSGSSSSSGSGVRKTSSGSSGSSGSSSSGSSSSGSGSSGSSSSGSSGSTGTTLASGRSEVKLSVTGTSDKVEVNCGDGQSRRFSGSTRMVFEGIVTCRVQQGGSMGVFTVQKTSAFTCAVSGDTISCSGG
ncbi:MAG: hypothetical protein H6739_20635 [Alphaproteobacteria bacterium]|nr:hypothetical protein [Alphaproteobacteria bacterium]